MIRIISNEKRTLLYNTFTDALVSIPPKYKTLTAINDNEKLLFFLKESLVLFDEEIDQSLLAAHLINKSKYSYGTLVLTDAMSYDCNLNCIYCMQQNTFKDVKRLSADERVDLWEKVCVTTLSEKIHLILFGGEPFYNIDYVEELLANAFQRNLPIDHISAITNGVNINERVIKLIQTYPFSQLQITLDGVKDIHDKRRYTSEKKGSFEMIINNIHSLLEHTNIEIIINTVIDNKNCNGYKELIDYLLDEFSTEIRRCDSRIIFNVGGECHPDSKSVYTENSIISGNGFMNEIIKALAYLVDHDCRIHEILPSPICVRLKENDLLIAPDGDIYKCVTGLGIDKFKLISRNEFLINPVQLIINQIQWIEKPQSQQCINCDFRALCNGGCMYNAYINGTDRECNYDLLLHSIDEFIAVLEKYSMKRGELLQWNES